MSRVKLTKAIIDKLEAVSGTVTLRDAEITGLSVRAYKSGKKAFFFRYRVGGGRSGPIREPKIGDFSALTVDNARKIARAWAAEVAEGGDPLADRQALRETPTMSHLFDRYLEEHAREFKKASSLHNDTRMIENSLRPKFGGRRVRDITRQDVRSYHSSLKKTPYEANRRLALLSKIFTFAIDDLELLPRSGHPVKGIKRFAEEKRRRYLSDEEVVRLGEALSRAEAGDLDRSISPHAIAMVRLLVITGARHGEILKLRWDEVNISRRCLELRDSKTGAKEIYLPPAALKVLAEIPQIEGNPYVIVGKKPGEHLVNIKDPWSLIREAAGLGDVRLHDLRHSFASFGARAGMSLPLIGALLGHASTTTTARYAHLSDDPLRRAADSIGDEISAALGISRTGHAQG